MLEQYYQVNQAAGLSIFIENDNSIFINCCSVSVNGEKLDIDKKITDLKSLEKLKDHFPAKTLIALNISGKGIIQKIVEKIDNINLDNFPSLLPNADLNDFYVQNFISGEKSFVAIIRKSEGDKWINQIQDLGFLPVILNLGPFAISNIIGQLNVYDSELIFNGYHIKRNEIGDWIAVSSNSTYRAEFPIKIESEVIKEKLLVPYASAFQVVLASKLNVIEAPVPLLYEQHKKIKESKKLKAQAFAVLASIFILLLLNFLIFSSLSSENQKLNEQISQSNRSSTDVQALNDKVKDKKNLLQILGWDGGVNKAGLIDQIASLLPEDITWSEVSINPIDNISDLNQKSLTFLNNSIRITGTSENIIPVNEWIARIKSKKWVKDIQLENFAFNSELNTGQFIISIKYQ